MSTTATCFCWQEFVFNHLFSIVLFPPYVCDNRSDVDNESSQDSTVVVLSCSYVTRVVGSVVSGT